MSRVKFKFGYTAGGDLTGPQARATIAAGREAFKLLEDDLKRLWKSGGYIICTGDQFAVFLIVRMIQGGQNQFSSLEPELLDPVNLNNVIDVTRGVK